jgi:hypothetical protein
LTFSGSTRTSPVNDLTDLLVEELHVGDGFTLGGNAVSITSAVYGYVTTSATVSLTALTFVGDDWGYATVGIMDVGDVTVTSDIHVVQGVMLTAFPNMGDLTLSGTLEVVSTLVVSNNYGGVVHLSGSDSSFGTILMAGGGAVLDLQADAVAHRLVLNNAYGSSTVSGCATLELDSKGDALVFGDNTYIGAGITLKLTGKDGAIVYADRGWAGPSMGVAGTIELHGHHPVVVLDGSRSTQYETGPDLDLGQSVQFVGGATITKIGPGELAINGTSIGLGGWTATGSGTLTPLNQLFRVTIPNPHAQAGSHAGGEYADSNFEEGNDDELNVLSSLQLAATWGTRRAVTMCDPIPSARSIRMLTTTATSATGIGTGTRTSLLPMPSRHIFGWGLAVQSALTMTSAWSSWRTTRRMTISPRRWTSPTLPTSTTGTGR